MPSSTPLNDLERALLAAQRSAAAQPEFFKRLLADQVWFLMPYHPEFEGVETLGPDAQVMLSCWKRKGEQVVPVFTAFERVEECWEKMKLPEKIHAFGQLQGARLLQMVSSSKMPVDLNPASGIGEAFFPAELVASLADGSALKPIRYSDDGPEETEITILDPADYPTDLVQPVFEFLRKHPNFRAAWVFGEGRPEKQGKGIYRVAVWMEPRDERLEQELGVVVRAADREDMKCCLTMMSDEEVESQEWTRHVPPFYRSA